MTTLTTDEMLADGHPMGAPHYIEAFPELGTVEGERVASRLLELCERAKSAYSAGFFVEYLSLMLLFCEVWLRMYLFGRGAYAAHDMLADKKTFGQLIVDCEKIGMDANVVAELRFLNTTRVSYVHKYLVAEHGYQDLAQHKPRLAQIPPLLQIYVINEVAQPVTAPTELGKPGQIVVFM